MEENMVPQSRVEEILISTINGTEYENLPQSRLEYLLLELKKAIEAGGGGGGTTNYNLLTNLPQINGVILKDDKSFNDLGMQPLTNEQMNALLTALS